MGCIGRSPSARAGHTKDFMLTPYSWGFLGKKVHFSISRKKLAFRDDTPFSGIFLLLLALSWLVSWGGFTCCCSMFMGRYFEKSCPTCPANFERRGFPGLLACCPYQTSQDLVQDHCSSSCCRLSASRFVAKTSSCFQRILFHFCLESYLCKLTISIFLDVLAPDQVPVFYFQRKLFWRRSIAVKKILVAVA